MRSRRVPDRVHVVRAPQDETAAPTRSGEGRTIEIVRMLAQISDKLKRSEAERYELLRELREYRKSLTDLEDKTGQTAKAYHSLQQKITAREKLETDLTERQSRFERALKITEDKLVKTAAVSTMIDKRIKDTENGQAALNERMDETVIQQARIDRQIEKVSQDRSRMIRKVERLEEILVETQDALKARAMVLLTDQSAAAQSGAPQIPAWFNEDSQNDDIRNAGMPWWRRSVRMQSAGMASMIIAALLMGWAINQVQRPQIPQIAVLEGGGLARLNLDEKRWEPIVQNNEALPSAKLAEMNDLEEATLASRLAPSVEETAPEQIEPAASFVEPVTIEPVSEQTPAAQEALDYSDEQLLQALEEDPEALASQLNEIAPQVNEAQVIDEAPMVETKVENFDQVAFLQNPNIEKEIKSDSGNGPLSARIKADADLPEMVRNIEAEALAGNAEAQHDLAAIYTAGHGGVTQNFEKAAFWFREASVNGIANARYNMGVLYHQGLGVERDLDKALYWYREAAKLDHPEAQYNLGIAHIEGIGTEYNPQLAAAFFERAANNGIMEAAYNLGLIYENGLMGTKSTDNALLWYKIAADQGSPDAKSAMQQLATAQQIGMKDVDNLVERMQQIYKSKNGRRAGPVAAEIAPAAKAQAVSVNSQQVMTAQIQEYLMSQGLYPGPADGISGPQTADAIRSYQKRAGLAVTGKASKDLLTHMLGQQN